MLPSATPFPQAGSFALLRLPIVDPQGRTVGVRNRRVRIQQCNRDGTLFVTAPQVVTRVGYRQSIIPAIHRTVERSELRRLTKAMAADLQALDGASACGRESQNASAQ